MHIRSGLIGDPLDTALCSLLIVDMWRHPLMNHSQHRRVVDVIPSRLIIDVDLSWHIYHLLQECPLGLDYSKFPHNIGIRFCSEPAHAFSNVDCHIAAVHFQIGMDEFPDLEKD